MNREEENPSLGPDEILMREYESIVKQIIHWDSHFWNKSQFFLAIQSAFIVVVFKGIEDAILNSWKIPFAILRLFLIIVVIFNIYICCIWFKTNCRTREYLKFRIDRALEIESDKKLQNILRTFHYTKERLPEYHQSASWEVHLPCGFIVVWVLILIIFCHLQILFPCV